MPTFPENVPETMGEETEIGSSHPQYRHNLFRETQLTDNTYRLMDNPPSQDDTVSNIESSSTTISAAAGPARAGPEFAADIDDIKTFDSIWLDESNWKFKMFSKKELTDGPGGDGGQEYSHIISRDASTDNKKNFIMCKNHQSDFINYMFSRPRLDRYYYEFIPEGAPVKLYFDMETNPSEGETAKTEDEWDIAKTAIINRTINAFEHWFPREYKDMGGLTHDDFVILNASGKDHKKNDKEKSSYHIVLANKFAFKDMTHLKKFLTEAGFFSRKPDMMDTSVYAKQQSMRTAESYKKGDTNHRFLKIEACPGFTPEECKAADAGSVHTPSHKKITKAVAKQRRTLKKMILASMISYIPNASIKLEVDMRKLQQQKKQELKAAKDSVIRSPDAIPLPASGEEILLKMCRALVDKDKAYVNNYDEWIRIGRLLSSAGAREDVWLEFSKMGDNPDTDQKLIEQWRYFGRQGLTHDPEMFYNFVRARCPDAVDDARMMSIDRMTDTPASIAQTMATLYGDKVAFDAGSWYHREGVHWRQDPDLRRIGEIIMTEFQREIEQKIRSLKAKNKEIDAENLGDEASPEVLETKAINDNRRETYENIKKITGAGRLGQDWFPLKTFFARPHFAERLDERQTILVFENGIIDLEGEPVLDDEGNPIMDEVKDYDGFNRLTEDGKIMRRVRRKTSNFELREPEQYIDEQGKPRMEFVQKSTGYNYYSKKTIMDPKLTPPEVQRAYIRNYESFQKYLTQVFPDDKERRYMLFMLATALDGSINHQHFYVWTGVSKHQNGSNSKSFLKSIIELVFGDYAKTCSPSLLTTAEPNANNANSAMMALKGARLAFFDEPDAKNGLKVGFIKRMTGGDEISTRELHGTQQTFKIIAKPIMLCNEIPDPDQKDGGFWRRFRPMPFMAKFVDDPDDPKWAGIDNVQARDDDLDKRIQDWRLPIIHLLLEIYAAYNTPVGETLRTLNGEVYKGMGRKMPKCKIIDDMVDDFKNENNVLKDWLDDYIIHDPQGVLLWKQLKTKQTDTIKALYKNKPKMLIDDISGPDGLATAFMGSKKFSLKKHRTTPYQMPNGGLVAECWGEWRLKTDDELAAEMAEDGGQGAAMASFFGGSQRQSTASAFDDE